MGGGSQKVDKQQKSDKTKVVKELEKIKSSISKLSEEQLTAPEIQRLCIEILNQLESQERIQLNLLTDFLESVEPIESKVRFGLQTIFQSKKLKELSFSLISQKSETILDLSPYRASLIKFSCLNRSEQVDVFRMKDGRIAADRFLTSFDISFREYTSLLPKVELVKLFTDQHDVQGENYFIINVLDLKSIIIMTRILLFRHIDLNIIYKSEIFDAERKFEPLPYKIHGAATIIQIFESKKEMFTNLLDAIYSSGENYRKRQRLE